MIMCSCIIIYGAIASVPLVFSVTIDLPLFFKALRVHPRFFKTKLLYAPSRLVAFNIVNLDKTTSIPFHHLNSDLNILKNNNRYGNNSNYFNSNFNYFDNNSNYF
jgi:hypothetical protein